MRYPWDSSSWPVMFPGKSEGIDTVHRTLFT